MPTICLYHKADFDGKASGAIVKRALPETKLIGVDYGEEFPWEMITADDDVVMVDWSLQPFQGMIDLQARCKSLVWIDHHSSVIKENSESYPDFNPAGVRDPETAACELTWKYYYPDAPVPWALQLLAWYDVWRHDKDVGVVPFQYGMMTAKWLPESPDWNVIFESPRFLVEETYEIGNQIHLYQQLRDEGQAAHLCFEAEIQGHRALVGNLSGKGSSRFESVWDSAKYDLMCSFAWDPRANAWSLGMYTDKPGVDVGEICKSLGGGGHAGSAGCHVKELPFKLKADA